VQKLNGAISGAQRFEDFSGRGNSAKTAPNKKINSRQYQKEPWKPLPQIAPIDGREPIGLSFGVGSDEEIRNQMLAWPSGLAVSIEG
jgi:hypothetical protein